MVGVRAVVHRQVVVVDLEPAGARSSTTKATSSGESDSNAASPGSQPLHVQIRIDVQRSNHLLVEVQGSRRGQRNGDWRPFQERVHDLSVGDASVHTTHVGVGDRRDLGQFLPACRAVGPGEGGRNAAHQ